MDVKHVSHVRNQNFGSSPLLTAAATLLVDPVRSVRGERRRVREDSRPRWREKVKSRCLNPIQMTAGKNAHIIGFFSL